MERVDCISGEDHGAAAAASAAHVYRERRASFAAEERRLAGTSFRFSVLRGGLFLGFAACLIAVLVTASSRTPGWWIAAGVFLVAFLLVLPVHDRIIREQRRAADLAAINEEALQRIAREWDRVPLPVVIGLGVEGPLARDLGLFGRASLFHLLGTAHTPPGKERLAEWFLQAAAPKEIALRQEAVAELASDLDLRQQLQVRARSMEKTPPDSERFLSWAEDRPWLLDRTGLVWLTRILPVLTFGALAWWIGRVAVGPPADRPWWPFAFMIAINFLLTAWFGKRLAASFNRIEAREDAIQTYAEVLSVVAERQSTAPRLRQITEALTPQGKTAPEWMHLLHKRVVLAEARRNTLHIVIQALLLWDFHALWLLERWQREAGPHVRRWLDALGDFEALSRPGRAAVRQPRLGLPHRGRERGPARRAGAWASVDPGGTAGDQRRGGRPAGHVPAGDRLQHVGQEHAAALDRGQRGARPGRRAGLRRGSAHAAGRRWPPASGSRTRWTTASRSSWPSCSG